MKVTLTCPDCLREFEREESRIGTGYCRSCSYGRAEMRHVTCVGCGEEFDTKEPDKKYCSQRCFKENYEPTEETKQKAREAGELRTGPLNSYWKHGKRAGSHE